MAFFGVDDMFLECTREVQQFAPEKFSRLVIVSSFGGKLLNFGGVRFFFFVFWEFLFPFSTSRQKMQ